MRQAFGEADIYISEGHGWNADNLHTLRDIASGAKMPKHMAEARDAVTAIELEDELLYESHKPVYIVDVPEGHELEKADTGPIKTRQAVDSFMEGNLDEALDNLRIAIQEDVEFAKRKDAYIADTLRSQLPQMLLDNPDLANKPDVKVLVQMGSSHTPIQHELSKTHRSKRVGAPILTYGFYNEYARKVGFEKDTSDSLLSKAMLEVVIESAIHPLLDTVDNQRYVEYLRKLCKNVSDTEIRAISTTIEHAFLTAPDTFEPTQAIISAINRVLHTDIEAEILALQNKPND